MILEFRKMSAKPVVLPPPPKDPKAAWTEKEKEFFETHGITDDKEKEVIRKRALVRAYDRTRAQFEKEAMEPVPEPKKEPKPWYKDDD
jgi:hypothetical protein